MFSVYGSNVYRGSGGSTVLVRNDIIHSQTAITTTLQAVAVRLTLHKTITLCSIYILPDRPVTLQELNLRFSQISHNAEKSVEKFSKILTAGLIYGLIRTAKGPLEHVRKRRDCLADILQWKISPN